MIISNTLNTLKTKCGLIPFIPAGVPNLQVTRDILYLFDQEGAAVIEIGLPYSDPLADGPTIQNASRQALEQGVNLDQVLELIAEVSPRLNAPIILFAYYNSLLSRGVSQFLYDLHKSGITGLVVPDLPLEEADYLIQVCSIFSVELVLFITPTSSTERINKILYKSPGAIYMISSLGVTGLRQEIQENLHDFVQDIVIKTHKPLILGFGISNLNHVQAISQWNIKGIVIGSAFVNLLSLYKNDLSLQCIRNFCLSIITLLR